MQVSVIPIGNSKGIRIPKGVLNQCQISDRVELSVKGDKIILEPLNRSPREGWAEMAGKMHENGDDELLIPDVFDDERLPEW